MLNFFKMTHSMYCDRKQKREDECDDLDHVPSAKRMKIKNSADHETICASHQNAPLYSDNPAFFASHKNNIFQSTTEVPYYDLQRNNNVAQSNPMYPPREECSTLQSDLKYLPDLSAVENPHYYENNKLLFELYVERIQRASISHSVSSSQQSF